MHHQQQQQQQQQQRFYGQQHAVYAPPHHTPQPMASADEAWQRGYEAAMQAQGRAVSFAPPVSHYPQQAQQPNGPSGLPVIMGGSERSGHWQQAGMPSAYHPPHQGGGYPGAQYPVMSPYSAHPQQQQQPGSFTYPNSAAPGSHMNAGPFSSSTSSLPHPNSQQYLPPMQPMTAHAAQSYPQSTLPSMQHVQQQLAAAPHPQRPAAGWQQYERLLQLGPEPLKTREPTSLQRQHQAALTKMLVGDMSFPAHPQADPAFYNYHMSGPHMAPQPMVPPSPNKTNSTQSTLQPLQPRLPPGAVMRPTMLPHPQAIAPYYPLTGMMPRCHRATAADEMEERRIVHNVSERRRRNSIREGFASLRRVIPALQRHKHSKMEVLRRAIRHVMTLQARKAEIIATNDKLRAEMEQFSSRDIASMCDVTKQEKKRKLSKSKEGKKEEEGEEGKKEDEEGKEVPKDHKLELSPDDEKSEEVEAKEEEEGKAPEEKSEEKAGNETEESESPSEGETDPSSPHVAASSVATPMSCAVECPNTAMMKATTEIVS